MTTITKHCGRGAALAALVTFASPPAFAQVAARKGLTLHGKRSIATAAATEARRLGAGGPIAVVDDGGSLLYLERLDNTFPEAAAAASAKTRTAATFRKPTRDFEQAIAKGRTSLVAVDVMTPLQGGVPIVVESHVVGAIGVSGAMSAQQDDDIATVAANAAASTLSTAATQTEGASQAAQSDRAVFIEAVKTTAIFEKGQPLIETAAFKVHASRRESAGGLWSLAADGRHLGTIVAPRHIHSMAWGDADRQTLYRCAHDRLYRIRLNVGGGPVGR